jgi:hypothetical protein
VRVFFGQVTVEVELEGGRGTCGLQGIAYRDCIAQGVERLVEASVAHRVRLGDKRRDLVEDGEDGFFLPVGMVSEDFVEEPEPFHRRFESWSTARRRGGGGVDGSHVGSERV